jgi:hypothetical protein
MFYINQIAHKSTIGKKIFTIITTLWYEVILADYISKVEDNYGNIDSEENLELYFDGLTEQSYNDSIALYNPNGGYRIGRIYDVRDSDNTTPYDFKVVGGGGTRVNELGEVEPVMYNLITNGSRSSVGYVSYEKGYLDPVGEFNARKVPLASSYTGRRVEPVTGVYNLSVFAKWESGGNQMILRYHDADGVVKDGLVNFQTGEIINQNEISSVTVTPDKNGYFRISFYTPNITNGEVSLFVTQSPSTFYWWGLQLTEGSDLKFPNSTDYDTAAYPLIDFSTGQAAFLIEPTRTNRLLNSATLSTQSYTTSAVPYTLSFYGTGSITLSGSHSATLTGTGTNTRVSLTFTPTAANLTLSVSGTVKNAQLEEGSTASAYIPTDNAVVTRVYSYYKTPIVVPIEYSIYVDFNLKTLNTQGWVFSLAYASDAVNNRIGLNFNATSYSIYTTKAGVNQTTIQISTPTDTTRSKILVKVKNNDVKVFRNGALTGSGTPEIPVNIDELMIGNIQWANNSSATPQMDMYDIKVLPLLTDQEAIDLTTI